MSRHRGPADPGWWVTIKRMTALVLVFTVVVILARAFGWNPLQQ